jgi:hypothetical protein
MPTYPKGSVNWAKQLHKPANDELVELLLKNDGLTYADEARMNKLKEKVYSYEDIMEDPNAPMGDPIYSKEELERDFGQMVIE